MRHDSSVIATLKASVHNLRRYKLLDAYAIEGQMCTSMDLCPRSVSRGVWMEKHDAVNTSDMGFISGTLASTCQPHSCASRHRTSTYRILTSSLLWFQPLTLYLIVATMTELLDLCYDVLIRILEEINPEDLAACAQTSSAFHHFIKTNKRLYKAQYLRNFVGTSDHCEDCD